MARNVNLTISYENDDTTRDNVPDYLIHMVATWTGNDGTPHEFDQDRYLLVQFNWLITNHPAVAKRVFQDIVYRIERVRQGMDEPEALR